jgi:hypothetical protein
MLREPHQGEDVVKAPKNAKKNRFKIEKLEERIVPRHGKGHYPGGGNCHYNPNAGKYVGCGKPN